MKECTLDSIHIFGVCRENRIIDDCTRLKELQEFRMEHIEGMEYIYYLAPKRPWKPPFSGMSQNPMQQFPQNDQYPIQNSWNAPIPWQTWLP